ncbi:MAG: thioredoxin domain-containing protein [Chloroflexi bacterium]|nr:thioredoxin domain-containing protein [Chloroflexota bacterium]
MTNRLKQATSPYLQQHAENPVDWYEWGSEALARAQEEDKPIFLSVGYAACHWCHVMAHESFEDTETAAILNGNFINIKVDREERPDIDAIYMDAVVALTGQGGWPMSVFLTPSGRPFYGGTYFPPADRYGMPSFRRLLDSIIDAWEKRRDKVDESAAQITDSLDRNSQLLPDSGSLTTDILDAAFATLYQHYDDANGGFGSQPKFPQAMTLEFLLRQHVRTGNPAPLAMVTHTLRVMANGGLYDQLGGGFHRYSTDAQWLVPHFEKMLYDNALLARVYLYTWQVTGDTFYKKIVEETLDYILREMTHPQGGFYSTQDADSEGVEGKFFVWQPAEVKAVLGQDEGALFCRFFDVSESGNFEGNNILHIEQDVDTFASEAGMTSAALQAILDQGKVSLFTVREQRIKPGRDEKVLSAWNGLMMRAMAEAGAALQRRDYLEAAVRNAEFIQQEMMDERGRLNRSWKDGQATLNGYLEDYSNVAEGMVSLFQATLDVRWLWQADKLMSVVDAHFWDDETGAAFQTSDDHEQLIVRRKEFLDNAEPSGNSAYATAAMRLGRLLDNQAYAERALEIFSFMRQPMTTQPSGFGHLLSALDFYLRPSREVVIIGEMDDPNTLALRQTVYGRWLPDTIVTGTPPGDSETVQCIPLLRDRTLVGGKAAAYVCHNFACKLPVTTPAELKTQLESFGP